MNAENTDFDRALISSLEGKKPAPGLDETIMARILLASEQERKRKKTEKTVMLIYSGLTIVTLSLLFFVKRGLSILPDLHFPELRQSLSGSPDLALYYKTAVVICIISLICFGSYFARSKSLITRRTMD
ncbi:hypothetical protein [Chitinophaga barathri]|uniref:Uncharacterized protein n=1 Tax=Chitinophaga barathri TaxID=1647451 RepID=A0A3N4M9G1_9BACT|nr:hypothetical protein [Chitinophaga barathri]RPD40161.1 hypothetical protein EG028_16035 [Chitinophaga barathri]